jgi:hypothetical protein
MSERLTKTEQQHFRRGVRWSAVLHVSLLAALFIQALWMPLPLLSGPGAPARQVLDVDQHGFEPDLLEVEMAFDTADDRPWILRDAEDVTYAQIDLSDPRWDDILTEPQRRLEGIDDSPADRAAASLLSRELLRSLRDAEARETEANFAELEQLSGRLKEVSSEESVAEVAGAVGRLFGTSERTAQPTQAEGPFDNATAQPHDCRKEQSPDGMTRYFVVMIDAQGRTEEIEVDETTGEQIHRTMQLIKSNPLLERVYRGVVMGILDKLLK